MAITQDELDSLARIIPSLRRSMAEAIEEGNPLHGESLTVSRGGVEIPLWLHRPSKHLAPLLVYLHGGGFALGDARCADALLDWTCRAYDAFVLGINYRLAPEHPYPSALDDVVASISWCASHARELDIDPHRIYLMGFSAGADLALASAMRLRCRSDLTIAGIIAHYPFFDCATDPSRKGERTLDVPVAMMQAFNAWYCENHDPQDPFISPLYASADQLTGLPPAIMMPVIGDPLFHEADNLAVRMRDAGGICMLVPVDGAYHGYIEDAANERVCRATESPEVIDARPHRYREAAGRSYVSALEMFLNRSEDAGSFAGFGEKGM